MFLLKMCPSYSSEFFFVEKKDKTLQSCIDCLNDITVKNWHQLPLISLAFELLQCAHFFNKPEFRNAYHMVHIWEARSGRLFKTPSGHYKFMIMPFGLTNAPAVFQNCSS